jgi:ATP-dependent helicase/nuclease subunit A
MTFTRQAAAEMRERIVRELRRAAGRSARDRARWRELRDRLGEIAISTVDAFCLSLLREFPLEADLDPGFEMADGTEVPRLVDRAVGRALAICGRLARQDEAMAMVLARLGPRRMREALAHLLHHRLVVPRAFHGFLRATPVGLTGEQICREALDRLRDAFGHGDIERLLSDGPRDDPRFVLVLRDLSNFDRLRESDPADARAAIDRIRALFLTRDGEPRRFRGGGVSRGYPTPEAIFVETARIVAPRVAVALEAFDRDLNIVLARAAQRMFAVVVAEYQRELESRALVDFSDVLQRARDLLRRMDEFSRSRYRLESRYLHVLVDEFQDTSRAQWELVSLLIQSWSEGLGLAQDAAVLPSVFIVGDRKQSIYRFRDAEVAVLEEAGEYIQALRPDAAARRSISHSFRARPELLAFVNDVFEEVEKVPGRRDGFRFDETDRFPLEETHSSTSDTHAGAESERGALGIVVAGDIDACADAVAAEVVRVLEHQSVRDRETGVLRRARPGDIAVLFRSRESHREFERALERRGLPACVYRGLGFFDADEIKDFRALMRYLANPHSELRAAAFLRSRIVRLSDEALATLARRLVAALFDPDLPAEAARLTDDDRVTLLRVRANLPRWLSLVDRLPPAELLDLILRESAYAYELGGGHTIQARENLKKMRGLVRRLQNRGCTTLGRSADHIDHLSGEVANAVVEAFDAVNLMTVHAAKGLEFPIVFLVNLGRGVSARRAPIHVIPDRGDGEPSVTVWPFRSEAEDDERLRDLEESKRLLYVAMTRARDGLYLSAVVADDGCRAGRGSLAEVLPAPLCALFVSASQAPSSTEFVCWQGRSGHRHWFRVCRGSATTGVSVPSREVVAGTGTPAIPDPRTTLVASWPEDVTWIGAPGHEPGLLLGRLVHRLLQTGPDEADVDRLRARARELLERESTAEPAVSDAAAERAARACAALRQRRDVLALLDGDCLFDVPFSMRLEDSAVIVRGSIDCLVRDRERRLIVVEFKPDGRHPHDQAQLALYIKAAKSLFPSATVEGQLIYA